MRLKDQVAIVTGASRGLGRAIAQDLAAEGAFVYAGYHVRAEECAVTLEGIRARGGDGAPLQCDVRDRAQVADAVDRVVRERGRVDLLVNNAAISRDAPFPLMDAADWDDVIAVNLTGAAAMCRAVSRPMLARRAGVIVNVGSIAGQHASAGQANYAASKGGLVAFTRTLAAELGPKGIRVNAVIPGLISTGMAARLDRRIADAKRADITLGRFGTPEEVSRVVVFLASSDASYIVGQAIVVDGGLAL